MVCGFELVSSQTQGPWDEFQVDTSRRELDSVFQELLEPRTTGGKRDDNKRVTGTQSLKGTPVLTHFTLYNVLSGSGL